MLSHVGTSAGSRTLNFRGAVASGEVAAAQRS